MWDKLRKQVALERMQLNRLLNIHRSLAKKSAVNPPDAVECSALAAMLHSFYTGVENIFKRIAVECDGQAPKGSGWHQALLDAMTKPGPHRPPVISDALRESLEAYLEFRHVFRQAYAFELRWEKMTDLVRDCENTWRQLQSELDKFVGAIGAAPEH